MSTAMYRLQISLPHKQVEFLRQRAKSEGSSIANVIRALIERETEKEYQLTEQDIANVMSIAGIAHDTNPLINGVPVSENVDLYTTAAFFKSHNSAPPPQSNRLLQERAPKYKTRAKRKPAKRGRAK